MLNCNEGLKQIAVERMHDHQLWDLHLMEEEEGEDRLREGSKEEKRKGITYPPQMTIVVSRGSDSMAKKYFPLPMHL
jgi:hypothetical protein